VPMADPEELMKSIGASRYCKTTSVGSWSREHAADEARISDRIADMEARLADLLKQRDELSN